MRVNKLFLAAAVTALLAISSSVAAFADEATLTWIDTDGDGVTEAYYFNPDGTYYAAGDLAEGNTGDSGSADYTETISTPDMGGEQAGEAGASDMASYDDLSAFLGSEADAAAASAAYSGTGRMDIVNFARQFAGAGILRYGTGNTLSGPADCSGFVQAVYRQFGINLPRTSRQQAASAPRYVSEAEMLPGDLIFYGGSIGTVSHVAIYTGSNSIVHATNSRRGWVFEDHGTRALHYEHIAAIGRFW
ncbi:C40 family peptidase [Oribacterium sp. WCC10]|uniref:C40 family peptidase n=1 Tax=Oribacterium sp. WCC10 TaxID=1855343 RepID=UPI0008E007AB|nr:C40 family peptidase [Oribacterium sp. WCC10]SFG06710.1 NlpC/P60 family protein [Oribacterium sp. WCC10]